MSISDESPSEIIRAKGGRRISLAALLLTPLALSPAFLSLYFASDVLAHQMQEFGAANWLLGFAYSSILTFFWYRGKGGPRNFVGNSFTWCLRRGAFAGLLYGLLLGIPLGTTKAMFLAGRMSAINIAGQTIFPAIGVAMISTLTGLAAGGLLGLLLPHRDVQA